MSENYSNGKNIKYVTGPAIGPNAYVVKGNDDIINVDTNAGPVDLILPNIKGSGFDLYRKRFYVNDVGGFAATNNITIYGSGGDEINGAGSALVSKDNGSVECVISNFNEYIVQGDAGGTFNGVFYSSVLCVDAIQGNNATAVPSRFDKPYLTVAAAVAAASAGQLVWVRPGGYAGTSLKTGVDIYCDAGVTFSSGFTNTGNAVTCNFYGNAKFTAGTPLSVSAGSTINFHFDTVNTTSFFASINPAAGTANVNFYGNSITTTGAVGFGATFRGPSNVKMFIKNFFRSFHTPLFFRTGTQGGFSGTFYAEIPEVRCTGGGTFDFQSGIRSSFSTTSTATITLKGNIYMDESAGYIGYNAGINTSGGQITLLGDIVSLEPIGILTDGTLGGSGWVKTYGNITTNREVVYSNHNAIPVYVQNGTLKTNGLGTFPQALVVGANAIGNPDNNSIFVRNCQIYNALANGTIVYKEGLNNTLNLYNCESYSSAAGGNFVTTTTAQIVGFHNVRSNKDNVPVFVTDAFTPSGFIFDAGFTIPLI